MLFLYILGFGALFSVICETKESPKYPKTIVKHIRHQQKCTLSRSTTYPRIRFDKGVLE